MPHSPLDRLDIPKPTGLMGRLRRAKWSLKSPGARRQEISQMIWSPGAWVDEATSNETLAKMRLLIDIGLWEKPILDDEISRRLQDRAKESELSSLGMDAMHVVVEQLPVAALQLLLEAGVDPGYRERANYSDTLLTAAVRLKLEDCLDVLIASGACLDVVDACSCSPLKIVVRDAEKNYGEPERSEALAMLKKLLAAGADPNLAKHHTPSDTRDDPPTDVLVEAACIGWTEGMECLIAAGAHLRQHGRGKSAVLMVANNFIPRPLKIYDRAFRTRFEEVIDLMLDVGAQVNVVEDDGNTPLLQAMRTGNMGIALALVERGAAIGPFPGQCTLAHLFCINADFSQPESHEFLARMPTGFWAQVDYRGNTVLDIMQEFKNEGGMKPHMEPWFAMCVADQMTGQTPTVQPESDARRPNRRL